MGKMVELSFLVNASDAARIEKDGLAEVFFRNQKKRFERAIKIAVTNSNEIDSEAKDKLFEQISNLHMQRKMDMVDVRRAMNQLDKKLDVDMNAIKDMAGNVEFMKGDIKNLEKLAALNVGLELANLAVNIAGFIIIANKLNKLSDEVKNISDKLDKVAGVQISDMVEQCQKFVMRFNSVKDKVKQDKVDIDSLETLVFDLRAYISKMVLNFNQKSVDAEFALKIISELMPAYTILLCEYLDRYYMENEMVPSNYEMFKDLYDELMTNQYKRGLEEHYMFDKALNTIEVVDAINIHQLLARDLKTQVEDQIDIMKELKYKDSIISYHANVEAMINEKIAELIPQLAEYTGISEDICRGVLVTK